MNHTPGPWGWYDRDGNELVTDFSELGLTLRTVKVYKDEIRIPGRTPFDLPKFILTVEDDVSEVDAKLIAKAPEIFELLKDVVKQHLKTCGRCQDRGPDTEEPCKFLPDAVMLIEEIQNG